MMRRQTALVLATFLGLSAAAVAALQRAPERGMHRLELGRRDLPRADTLVLTGEHALTLERREGAWMLPGGHRADAELVDGAIAQLARISSSDLITQETGRFTDLGVEGPKATGVQLRRGSRVLADLRLGGEPAGAGAYVREGDAVYRVSALAPQAFSRPADAWEDRHLHRDAAADIARIAVRRAGALTLEVEAHEGTWRPVDAAAPPTGVRFDAGAAQALTHAIAGLRAERLVDEDPGEATTKLGAPDADLGDLPDAVRWIRRTEAGDEPRTLQIGAPCEGGRYARMAGQPQLFVLGEAQVQQVQRGWRDMRALTVMASADFEKIARAIVTPESGRPMTFARDKDGQWAPAAGTRLPAGATLEVPKLKARLHQVLLARAIQVVDGPPGRFGVGARNTASIRLLEADGTAHTLRFGRAQRAGEGVGYYAQGDADASTYVISRALHDTLLGGLETLTRRPPAAMAPGAPMAGATPGLTPEMEAQIRRQLAQAP